MMEPFAVALHAVKRAGTVSGKKVLVTGGGPIGLLVLITARAFGAAPVVLSDIVASRRDTALKLGADAALDPAAEHLGDQVRELAGDGFDVVFEASGAPPALRQAFGLVRPGGTIVQIGTLGTDDIPLPANQVMSRETQFIGSFRYGNVFGEAIRLAAAGRVNLAPLISQVFPLAELPQAMRRAFAKDSVMKIQISISSDPQFNMNVSVIDQVVIAVYLIGITAFGIWIGFRRHASSEQYFLANKSLGWFTVGAAVFTSNISTIHLVGLAAGGAKDGMVIGNFEWMACFTLIALALVFAPFYINSGVSTLPEFMERRYCPQARTFLAIIGLLGALLIHIGISLFAAAKVFESFLGVPMVTTIIVLSLFTVTYTALGGLKAVVMTENIQVCLLLGGATLVTVLGIQALPGVGVHDLASFKAAVAPGQLNMLQPVINSQGHLNEFSWLGVLLGYPILGIWYWCADQTHVQRVLGARNLKAGQNGALFAGFLKITPVFLMVLPGVIGYVLWQKGAFQLLNVPGTGKPDYNTMLPSLINYLIPVGLKGLLAASMAAALMSCMAAALNSCATLDFPRHRQTPAP